jgi:hypothetical protein
MRAVKPKPNRDTYWQYALCYVNNILIISNKPQEAMDYLSSKYKLKEGSVKETNTYLGADIKKWNIDSSADPTKTRWQCRLTHSTSNVLSLTLNANYCKSMNNFQLR